MQVQRGPDPDSGDGIDVGADDPAARRRLADGVHITARWALRLLVIAGGLWVLSRAAGWLWPILLPVFLALLITSVLWPPVRWMRRRLPPALAAALGLLLLLGLVGGLIWLIVPVIVDQTQPLADQASAGLSSLETWLSGPPFNLG